MIQITESLERAATRYTKGKNRKTKAGYNLAAKKLSVMIENHTTLRTLTDIQPDENMTVIEREDFEDAIEDELIKAFDITIKAKDWGSQKSTIGQMLTNARCLLTKIGFNPSSIQNIKNESINSIMESDVNLKKVEYVPTPNDIKSILKVIDEMKNPEYRFENATGNLSMNNRIQASLYVMLAMSVTPRAGSLRAIEWEDITEHNIKVWIVKQKSINPESIMFNMNELLWASIQQWRKVSPKQTGSIWTNKADVSKWGNRVLKVAGMPSINNRCGVHMFRKAFATYCYNNEISLEHAAAGLGHQSSSTTEKYYISNYAKGQKAADAMGKFNVDFMDAAMKMSTLSKTMTAWSDALQADVNWGQAQSDDYWLQEENKAKRDFLIESGVNPFTSSVHMVDSISKDADCNPSDFGSNPRGTTKIRNEFKALVPHIEAALAEMKNGSSTQAEIILSTLKEVLQ